MAQSQEWYENERRIIDRFFILEVPKSPAYSGEVCNEELCMQFARSILVVDDLVPVDNQGSNSFTLISHHKSKIVQFRLQLLKTDVLELAHEIYGDLVPEVKLHPGFALPVYTSNVLSGKIFFLLDTPEEPFPLQRQLRTVNDLAVFITKATCYPQSDHTHGNDDLMRVSRINLEKLLSNRSLQKLAPELLPIIEKLHAKLPLLELLPRVLTHHDLAQINILVDEKDGSVTGVIDFDQAGIEVFGTCIWGVFEGFFGAMNDGQWSFFNQDAADHCGQSIRQILEFTFWSTFWTSISPQIQVTDQFKEAVRVAARIGVIQRYFVQGMMDEIEISKKVHRYSLEYVKGILPAI